MFSIIILGAMAVDGAARTAGARSLVAVLAVCVLLASQLATDRQFYADQTYDPGPIVEAWRRQGVARAPVIDRIALQNSRGSLNVITRNNLLAEGGSQLRCYEPMFGYQLEAFPRAPLKPGPVMDVKAGRFNMKNPACYIYGPANACKPGDHFKVSESESLKAFVHYRPWPFKLPVIQRLANGLSLVALMVLLGVISWSGFERFKDRQHF